ncbi:MAG: hypothetical protein KKC75_08810 [Nanoarchaeota archaeon]|nr:hypothetical protein [Nanoarchaeota archaeon]MBU1004959.1 hypothetical protein [Nanoarchaeota archaeon]MBU1946401.1 hypothetical protein [Nanoarchaeota archaeon]
MRKLNSKCKRGMLFTLGMTLLSFVVLSLAILVFHNAQKSEILVSKLAVLDRVYELDTSIQQSLRDIFYLKSGISVNITEDSIIFQESLPNPNKESFNASMTSFKRFIESNLSNVNISIGSIVSQLPLTIQPNSIIYKHVDFGDKQIEVIPEQINFEGYSIQMIINKNVTSCSWDTESGSFTLSIIVTGPNGAECSGSQPIDPSEENEVNINNEDIEINIESNVLSISIDDDSTTADVQTTILTGNSEGYIEYDWPVVSISFADFGISKQSKTRIR